MKMSKSSKPAPIKSTREEATLVLTNAAGLALEFDAIWDKDGSIQVIESRTPNSYGDFISEIYASGFGLSSVRIHLDGYPECGADVAANSHPKSGHYTTPDAFAEAVSSRPSPVESLRSPA